MKQKNYRPIPIYVFIAIAGKHPITSANFVNGEICLVSSVANNNNDVGVDGGNGNTRRASLPRIFGEIGGGVRQKEMELARRGRSNRGGPEAERSSERSERPQNQSKTRPPQSFSHRR